MGHHDLVTATSVTIADIEAARERLTGQLRMTPLWPSVALSEQLKVPVYLKCENLQRTGSFKLRGASNMLALASPRPPGVIAASAGNHAQGVALAAREHGLPALVFMPRSAPLSKQRATRGYGAAIELVDGPLSAAQEQARAAAAARGWLYIPPYDAPAIVAGQGTVGLELLEQLPDLATVIIPAGGGGLLAGVATAIKTRRPDARVIGVQAAAMPGIRESLIAGQRLQVPAARTLADGVAVAGPSDLTLDLIRRHVDEVVTITEEEIASALLFLVERARLVAEGAGALAVAALLAGLIQPGGPVIAVVSGGNIDINLLGRLVQRGLQVDGRQVRLTIAAGNVPGELATITAILAAARINVIEVSHDLTAPDLPVGVARITLRIDVADPESHEGLLDGFLAAGFERGTVTDLLTPAAASWPL